jgi:hypothetical protein
MKTILIRPTRPTSRERHDCSHRFWQQLLGQTNKVRVDVQCAFLAAELNQTIKCTSMCRKDSTDSTIGAVVLLLKPTLYGPCQATIQLWKKLCMVLISARRTSPRVNHLDVVGRLNSINEWKPRIHSAPLPREPGRAVALGRGLVLT